LRAKNRKKFTFFSFFKDCSFFCKKWGLALRLQTAGMSRRLCELNRRMCNQRLRYIVFYLKDINSKSVAHVPVTGITFTLGVPGSGVDALRPRRNTAIASGVLPLAKRRAWITLTPAGVLTAQGVANPADLLLEGCGAATAVGCTTANRWGRSAKARSPDKPEFFAEQKMRPNEVVKNPSTVFYMRTFFASESTVSFEQQIAKKA
jgi:hypothetical protein